MTTGPRYVQHLPAIRALILDAVPTGWPGLRQLGEQFLRDDRPEAMLPLAACEAAGGGVAAAVPVAAALVAAELSVLIADDVYDQDRSTALWRYVGPQRAGNVAAAFQTLSFTILAHTDLPSDVRDRVLRAVCAGYLDVAAGQDLDLANDARDLDSCWTVSELKTGAAYATALEAGALVANGEPGHVDALRTYGYHLGLMTQIVNDLRGIWFPPGPSDLARGKVTLPLAYALSFDHPDRTLLRTIVDDGQVANSHRVVLQILDRVDARGFLVWAALQHRDSARKALAALTDGFATAFLRDYVLGCFGNVDELLDAHPPLDGAATDLIGRAHGQPGPVELRETPVVSSPALVIRQTLREGRP